MNEVIEKIWSGEATALDVYRALGAEITPHRRMWGRVAIRFPGEPHFRSMGNVIGRVDDALHLVRDDRREEAMRAAMALNREMENVRFGSNPIARRLCVIALTRLDLRARM